MIKGPASAISLELKDEQHLPKSTFNKRRGEGAKLRNSLLFHCPSNQSVSSFTSSHSSDLKVNNSENEESSEMPSYSQGTVSLASGCN